MTRRLTQYLVILAAIALLIAVLLFSRQLVARQNEHRPMVTLAEPLRPDVVVKTVSRGMYTARVEGYGEAKPHFSVALTAQTTGLVLEQWEQFEPGNRVKKGDVLLTLDDSDYLKTLAEAKSDLATAELALLEEEREASQAKTEWKASGLAGEPDSELVLHKPQLVAAKAAVAQAKAALTSAQKDVNRCRIRAPFDAVIIERLTAPGSYLQAGTEVATLYSTDMMEISIPLAAKDWANLPVEQTLTTSSWPVRLTGVESGATWQGRVLRSQLHLDETSRQRKLLLALDSPFDQAEPLLPGTFVLASLEGKSIANIWELPDTALSQRGEIWYVTEDNTLACFMADSVFTSGNNIYIRVPQEFSDGASIVVHPLSSYLSGMVVNPVEEDHNA